MVQNENGNLFHGAPGQLLPVSDIPVRGARSSFSYSLRVSLLRCPIYIYIPSLYIIRTDGSSRQFTFEHAVTGMAG